MQMPEKARGHKAPNRGKGCGVTLTAQVTTNSPIHISTSESTIPIVGHQKAIVSTIQEELNPTCHTLISSGDHLFVGMRPSLDHFEVLDTHR